jgi:hypothetical protein
MPDAIIYVLTAENPTDPILRLAIGAQGRVWTVTAPMTLDHANETAEILVALVQVFGRTAIIKTGEAAGDA